MVAVSFNNECLLVVDCESFPLKCLAVYSMACKQLYYFYKVEILMCTLEVYRYIKLANISCRQSVFLNYTNIYTDICIST